MKEIFLSSIFTHALRSRLNLAQCSEITDGELFHVGLFGRKMLCCLWSPVCESGAVWVRTVSLQRVGSLALLHKPRVELTAFNARLLHRFCKRRCIYAFRKEVFAWRSRETPCSLEFDGQLSYSVCVLTAEDDAGAKDRNQRRGRGTWMEFIGPFPWEFMALCSVMCRGAWSRTHVGKHSVLWGLLLWRSRENLVPSPLFLDPPPRRGVERYNKKINTSLKVGPYPSPTVEELNS